MTCACTRRRRGRRQCGGSPTRGLPAVKPAHAIPAATEITPARTDRRSMKVTIARSWRRGHQVRYDGHAGHGERVRAQG
jgi:hypothetical protein